MKIHRMDRYLFKILILTKMLGTPQRIAHRTTLMSLSWLRGIMLANTTIGANTPMATTSTISTMLPIAEISCLKSNQ